MSSNKSTPGKLPLIGDRDFIYGADTLVKQTKAVIGGNDTAWTSQFVSYYDDWCGPLNSPGVGLVNMTKYAEWLSTQGVNINFTIPATTGLCP